MAKRFLIVLIIGLLLGAGITYNVYIVNDAENIMNINDFVKITELISVERIPFSDHSWTKALYNGTHIQDFIIYCRGSFIVKMVPTDAVVYVGENWTYPNYVPKGWKNKWCS